MKIKPESCPKRLIIGMILLGFILIGSGIFAYKNIYKNIKVKVKKDVLEYGSGKNIKDIIGNVDGKITEIKKDIDTSKVGVQELVVKVEKDSVVKEIPVKIEVKDTKAPEIKVAAENVSLNVGDSFDPTTSNVSEVSDTVDGKIDYQKKEDVQTNKTTTNYYTVDSAVNTEVAGTYPVTVTAVDKNGNTSSTTYNVEVKPKTTTKSVAASTKTNNTNSAATTASAVTTVNPTGTGDKATLVSLAYSLIGSPYISGGNTPAGFDCSGFVQYLYSQIGIKVSRSSSTQMNDGVAVNYENAQPGDILSWGYTEGHPTHSAIYVGNGMMIHATNPRQGVLLSSVAGWTSASGIHVIAVRRI